jgi:hypothetical protein
MSVADDKQTVGWAITADNSCCTSYPIAIAVVVSRNSKKTVIASSQMVWEWHFVSRGKRLAILSGPVHGSAAEAILFAARDGKKLAAWNGSGTVPVWADMWKDDF